jgi:hypothetical protein
MSYHRLNGLGLDLSASGMGKEVANYLDPLLRTVLAQEGPKLIAQVGPMVAAQVPNFVAQVGPVLAQQAPILVKQITPAIEASLPGVINAIRPTVQNEILKLRPVIEAELADAVNGPIVKAMERKAVLALALHAVAILGGVALISLAVRK